ncbi:MAG: matrixin family metalloprotease [Myxococcota bacterium]
MRFLLVATLLATAAPAYAYRTLADDPAIPDDARVVWDAPVALEVSRHGLGTVREVPIESALRAAIAAWVTPSCSSAAFTSTGFVAHSATPGDGRSTIEWVDDWSARGLGGDVAATTDIQFVNEDGAWRITEADVYLNGSVRWDVFHPGPVTVSLEAVLIHELGHVLGLAHPCEGAACTATDQASALFPTHAMNAGVLAADDVDGLCSLYPASRCSISCDAGFVCRDGECVSADDVVCPDCGPRSFGASCESDGQCESSLCALGRCTTTCERQEDCSEGAECGPEGWCRAPMLSRDVCEVGEDCMSGLCLQGEDDAACTNECLTDAECLAGEVCVSVGDVEVCAVQTSSGCAVGGTGASMSWMLVALFVIGRRRAGEV